jgi:hypothetical protein
MGKIFDQDGDGDFDMMDMSSAPASCLEKGLAAMSV